MGAIGASAGMVISRAVVRDLAEGTRAAILMSRCRDGRQHDPGATIGAGLALRLAVHFLVPGAVWRILRLVLVMGVAPILAPTIGAGSGGTAAGGFIFWVQALYGASCAVLAWRLLPETLPEDRRVRVGLGRMAARYVWIAREPIFRTHAIMGCATTFRHVRLSGRFVAGVHPGVQTCPRRRSVWFSACARAH